MNREATSRALPRPPVPQARPIAPEQFRAGMRRMAGVVCVIATGSQGQRAGLTATAVCSVSAEPPRLLVCVNAGASAHDPMQRAGMLSVNVLRATQREVAMAFSSARIKGEDRFSAGRWSQALGVPVLHDTSVTFVCRVGEQFGSGTHTIFLCDVIDCRIANGCGFDPGDNLLYFDGEYRRLQSETCGTSR